MIKSTRQSQYYNDTGKDYPKLMVSYVSSVIVLMVKDGHGTIVSGKSKHGHGVGEYFTNWSMWDMFDYEGSITLTNE